MQPPGDSSQLYKQAQNKGIEDDTSSKWQPTESGVPILISDKTDVKPKEATRDRDGRCINLKRGHQEDITLINAYALNIGAAKYKKQLLKDLKKLTAT